MYKAALALLVGLMLPVSGSTWGTTTFKDGIINSDNLIEKPMAESTGNRKTGLVGKILAGCVGDKGYSKETRHKICRDFNHNKCAKLEMKNRGLTCGEDNIASNQDASTHTSGLLPCASSQDAYWHNCHGTEILTNGTTYVGEYRDGKRNGQFTVTYADGDTYVGDFKDNVFNGQGTYTYADGDTYVGAWKNDKMHGQGTFTFANGRTAMEGIWKDNEFQYATKLTPSISNTEVASSTNNQANTSTSARLEAERQKRIEAEQELAELKAQQEQQQQNIAADGQPPVLTAQANVDGSMASIFGSAADNIGVAELLVDGLPVQLSSDGSFETSLYVPRNGKQVEVTVFDLKGNQADKILTLQRSAVRQASGPVFGSLNPSGKRVMPNNDALALIIGVADYERTPAKAAYADKDAKTFYDYAMLKLGIPASNIKELVNDSASEIDVRLAGKDWVARSTKQNASDIYVFFAGHGLASQSGEEMYLLPYDGEPRLLEDSAIKRTRLFDDIASANPRSVTVFLDTCYSGTTRGTDMLIASRPIAIKALKRSVPDNFTVMTAAAGNQTAKPLEEAKHGMFSYFLMKGMEGEADANQDNRITAGELHSYVQTNVIQQSSGSQTPELQGNADRVLVRFQ